MITIWYSVRGMTQQTPPGRELLARNGKHIPLYVQVAALIRQRIYRKEFRKTGILPSETTLMGEYGVSRSVIRDALGLLRREELVVTEHGVGSRIGAIPSQVQVTADPGDVVESRMPTRAEREALDMPQGVPLVVLIHPDGRGEEIYNSLRTKVVVGNSA